MDVPSEQTLKRHGLTEDQWQALWDRQAGLCALCGKPPTSRFVIDHCHRAARNGGPAVRGLIHPMCNGKLGKVKDSAEWCRQAAAYLDRGPDPELGPYPAPVKRKRRRRNT